MSLAGSERPGNVNHAVLETRAVRPVKGPQGRGRAALSAPRPDTPAAEAAEAESRVTSRSEAAQRARRAGQQQTQEAI